MKKEGGKIFNAPSKKVGDTMKDLDEKITKGLSFRGSKQHDLQYVKT